MHHLFIRPSQLSEDGKVLRIEGEDFHHITRVLRMKAGGELSASLLSEERESVTATEAEETDSATEREYRFGIEEIAADHILCRLRFVKEGSSELPARISLLQCLPKGDKMEQIIQKAVELGVHEVIPVRAKRCVMKLEQAKAEAKTARWQKIAEAAAMQSKRGIVPKVCPVTDFSEALSRVADFDLKLLPYELAAVAAPGQREKEDGSAASGGMEETRMLLRGAKDAKRIAVCIGPEGGFEDAEVSQAVAKGFHAVTLGRRILRTETAGITVLSWLMFLLEP